MTRKEGGEREEGKGELGSKWLTARMVGLLLLSGHHPSMCMSSVQSRMPAVTVRVCAALALALSPAIVLNLCKGQFTQVTLTPIRLSVRTITLCRYNVPMCLQNPEEQVQ